MAFKGITFAGQNVRPQDDGALYQAHYGDGILDGCSMTISGDDLVIQSGHFIAGGRVCHVDGATNVDLSGRVNITGYIQVIMNYDMSQGEGSQWYTTFVESASTTFPALTTDDINGTGTLYQVQLAIIEVSGGNLTSIVLSMNASALVSRSFRNIDGSGDTLGQLLISDLGNVIIGANNSGGNIYIRPFGTGSNSNQVYFDTSGQQIGGHPLINKDSSATTTITASTSTYTNLASMTGLTTAGVYLITGRVYFAPSSNTSSRYHLALSTNNTGSNICYVSHSNNSSAGVGLNVAMLVTGESTVYLNFQSSSVGGSASGVMFRAVRIS